MGKSNRNVQWSLSCFFGWMLSFPFSGPILKSIVPEPQTAALALIFIGFHGITLLMAGLLVNEKKTWKNLLLVGGSICGAGHIFLLISRLTWHPEGVMAVMGIASALFVLGWTRPYTLGTMPEQRIKKMAATIITANIILFVLNFLSHYLNPLLALLLSLVPLAGALWFARNIKEVESPVDTHEPGPFPTLYISLVSLFSLMIYINGGFLYNLIYPTVATSVPYSHYFRLLTYIGVLLVIWFLGLRVKKTILVYLGASVMGLAFVLFGLFGGSVIGSAVISLFIESSFGFIDLFTWTVPAAIALMYKRSFRVFGFILSANVASIFIGYLLGQQLIIRENYEITTGLFASATIFLAFLLLPWLKEFAEKEARTILPLAQLNQQLKGLPILDILTPRETEILGLMLDGHSNKKTAGLLFISENTLKTHLKSIYIKLGISHKRELFSLIINQEDIAPPKTS